MDIIALSLGLQPVPPLPADVVRKQINRTRELQREAAREGYEARRHGPTVRAELRELLRTTGESTLGDIVTYYGWSNTNAKAHLARLLANGHIRVEQRMTMGRLTNYYSYAEDAA